MTPVASIEENLIEFFRHFARFRPSGRIAELDGVSIASAGLEFHMFNAAFFAATAVAGEEDLGRRLALAAGFLGGDGARWAFWACEEKMGGCSPRPIDQAFRRLGMFPAYLHPGMVCDELLPARRLPVGVEFRRVEDAPGRIEFARLNSLAFRVPFEWCLGLYDIEELWNRDFTGYTGYSGSQAVCCAATLVAAEAVGVYSVATLPGYERRGYGEAATRHAVACAQRDSGLRRSILQATNAGLPLYRHMGFELATHFVVYSR